MQCVVIEVANYVSEYFLFIANCLNPIVLCLGLAFCLLLAHFNMLAIYGPYLQFAVENTRVDASKQTTPYKIQLQSVKH